VVVPALAIVLPLWLERRALEVRWPHVAAAAALAALVALPWYVAMVVRHGTAYVESFLVGDNLERFTTTRFNDNRPIWFYLPVIAGGLMPWSAFGVGAAAAGLASLARRQWHLSRDDVRLLCWAGVPTLFFMASVGQQPRYVLPVLPPLAILTARAVGERIEGGARRPADDATGRRHVGYRAHARPVRGAAVPAAAAARRHAAGDPRNVGHRHRRQRCRAGDRGPSRRVDCPASRRRRRGTDAAARPAVQRARTGQARRRRTDGRVDCRAPDWRRAAGIAARVHAQPHLLHGPQAARPRGCRGASRFLAQDGRVLVVLLERDLATVSSVLPTPPQVLARVRHLNTANLRLRSVLNPDPDNELETWVLATNR
jgi:hypothetical protein